MRWLTKALLLRTLALLPGAEHLNVALKRRLAARGGIDVGAHLAPALKMLGRLREVAGFDPEGRACLELGVGWYPGFAVLLSTLGAREIHLLDVGRFLGAEGLAAVARALAPEVPRIAAATGKQEEDLAARLASIVEARDLAARLGAARIVYHAPMDAARTGLPDGAIDLIYSNCVLEHIPETDLPAVHREAARLLAPGGLAYHIVDLSDHFSHGDPARARLAFLCHGDRFWRFLGQHRLHHANRLRLPEHTAAIERAGLSILHVEAQRDPRDLDFVRRVRLAPRFARFSPEENAVHLAHVVARR